MTSFVIVLSARLLFLFIILSGCAGKNIASDLVIYVNNGILDIAGLETEALKKYASVTGGNYTGDEALYETLKNEYVSVVNSSYFYQL